MSNLQATAGAAANTPWVVLLVDDQELVAERITFMLSRQAELKVVYCRDGKAAVEMVRASRPSVVLQDLVMPEVIGTTKFSYDLWGDAVEVAWELTRFGAPGSIQVEEAMHERLRETHLFEYRGEFFVQGKGAIRTFFLKGRRVPEEAPTPGKWRGRRAPHLPRGV